MAAYCTLLLNGAAESMFTLSCQAEGLPRREQRFPAFSGIAEYRNKPNSTQLKDKGPIPLGLYYIVGRDCGGILGCIRTFFSDKSEWFALYRDDGLIDDSTWIGGVQRGEFRLHPGPGNSKGCITIVDRRDFDTIRGSLRLEFPLRIPDTDSFAYGTVFVWCPGQSSGPVRIPPQLKMRSG